MTVRAVRFAIGAVTIAWLLGACTLIPLFFPLGGAFPSGPVRPTDVPLQPGRYTHGTATVTLTSGEPRTVEMRIDAADVSAMVMGLGASVAWRGDDWGLHIVGGGAGRLRVRGADWSIRSQYGPWF